MIYYEFMVSSNSTACIRFISPSWEDLPGCRLPSMQPDQKWTQDERRNFLRLSRFREAFGKQNREGLQVTPGMPFVWLAVYPSSSIAEDNAELLSSLESIWPDVRLWLRGSLSA